MKRTLLFFCLLFFSQLQLFAQANMHHRMAANAYRTHINHMNHQMNMRAMLRGYTAAVKSSKKQLEKQKKNLLN